MPTTDDILLNKAAIIKRALARIDEEYLGYEDQLDTDFRRQDSIILNLQRSCEAAMDMGTRFVRLRSLGVCQSSREIFALLASAEVIPQDLCERLQAMVGFRNIAVHDYQQLNIDIVRSVLDTRLNDFRVLSACLLQAWADTESG